MFELAAPDDATDEEFIKYESLINAYYSGVHANGYLGYGDSMTLKVKTRLDNLGSEDTAVDESMFDAEGKLISYKDQMANIATWDSEDASVYITAHATDLKWMEDPLDLDDLRDRPEKGWLHLFKGDVEIPEGTSYTEGVLQRGDTGSGWWTTGINVTVRPERPRRQSSRGWQR